MRTPFYFESQGDRLFAWLHRLESASRRDHGVILCPPIGHEQIHAHRSLRHLADAVAAAGFPVVRFDYHGTGDSGGSAEEADGVATWLANIRDASDWLEQQTRLRTHQPGRAAARGDARGPGGGRAAGGRPGPVGARGQGPLLRARNEGLEPHRGGGRPASEPAGGIEAAGFTLPEKVALELGGSTCCNPGPSAAAPRSSCATTWPPDAHLLAHFSGLGIDAEQAALPGYADMMAEPHEGEVPRPAIARIVDWLAAGSPEGGRGRVEIDARTPRTRH